MADCYYHATYRRHLPSIMSEGLRPGTFLAASPALADYYAETICDEAEEPAILEIPASALDEALLAPDLPGIDEPIMTVIRRMHDLDRSTGEDWVLDQWAASRGDWQACVEIISSVRYTGLISASSIKIDGHALCTRSALPGQ